MIIEPDETIRVLAGFSAFGGDMLGDGMAYYEAEPILGTAAMGSVSRHLMRTHKSTCDVLGELLCALLYAQNQKNPSRSGTPLQANIFSMASEVEGARHIPT